MELLGYLKFLAIKEQTVYLLIVMKFLIKLIIIFLICLAIMELLGYLKFLAIKEQLEYLKFLAIKEQLEYCLITIMISLIKIKK